MKRIGTVSIVLLFLLSSVDKQYDITSESVWVKTLYYRQSISSFLPAGDGYEIRFTELIDGKLVFAGDNAKSQKIIKL